MSVWQFSGDWLSQFVPGSVFSQSAQLLSGCGHVQHECDDGGGGGDSGGDGGWNRHHVYLPFFWQFSGERLSQFPRGSHTSHSAQLLTGCGHVQHEPIGGGGGGGGGDGDGGGGDGSGAGGGGEGAGQGTLQIMCTPSSGDLAFAVEPVPS